MSFTGNYLQRCWDNRRRWRKKASLVGDWYLTSNPLGMGVVCETKAKEIDFSRDDIAYVPDADDLLELLNNQIRGWGEDPAKTPITISYSLADGWGVEIQIGNALVSCRDRDPLHALLLRAVFQSSVLPEEIRPKANKP